MPRKSYGDCKQIEEFGLELFNKGMLFSEIRVAMAEKFNMSESNAYFHINKIRQYIDETHGEIMKDLTRNLIVRLYKDCMGAKTVWERKAAIEVMMRLTGIDRINELGKVKSSEDSITLIFPEIVPPKKEDE